MPRQRALVQRTGRKMHWASLGPGEAVWLTVCNREVSVFGATEHGRDWAAWLAAGQDLDVDLCSQCRTPLLAAGLALAEIEEIRALAVDREALLLEVRELRAERAAWTTAALAETRAAAKHRWER